MSMPASSQPSRAELFYDLVLIGAFLSFGVDFGKEPNLESALMLALKLTLIMWAWEQTALFFNRFGNPFAASFSGKLLPAALRAAFLLQLVGVVAVSLLETSELQLAALGGELGYAA
ncbi:MAG: low temperature requirement protein A, partial [Solirubrobacteraceae bacterium]|nr:low temperature requirement protein A [Solirubrobacteraceae bacterium]